MCHSNSDQNDIDLSNQNLLNVPSVVDIYITVLNEKDPAGSHSQTAEVQKELVGGTLNRLSTALPGNHGHAGCAQLRGPSIAVFDALNKYAAAYLHTCRRDRVPVHLCLRCTGGSVLVACARLTSDTPETK